MKLRDRLAGTLRELGVQYVFGVPGGEITDLVEGFRAAGLRFVLTRHEAAAAFMAEAVGTLTGIPGVCASTLGPGATNMVSGVAQGYLDRSPMIAISGQLPEWRQATSTHQVLDLQTLYSPITKWRAKLKPESCEETIRKAVDIATSERPGPVFIEVQSDLGNSERGLPFEPFPTLRSLAGTCCEGDLMRGAEMLSNSRKPVIVVGNDAFRSNCTEETVKLAKKLGAPVISTPKGKSVYPEDDPLFVGTLEMLASDILFDLLEASDCLITIGVDPVELMGPWPAKPGIYVNSVPNFDRYYTSSLELVGSIGANLLGLSRFLENREELSSLPKWDHAEITGIRQQLMEKIPDSDESLFAKGLFEILNKVMPENTLMSCDIGAHKFATGQMWRPKKPRSFLMSNGLSSMGYGLTSAIAAKLVHPESVSATVVGDGGLAMYTGELDTARRLGIHLVIVVCVDNALSLIKMNQTKKGYVPYGVEFSNPDWVQVARGMGIEASRADDKKSLQSALEKALQAKGPYLVEARIDPRGYGTDA